MSKFKIEVLTRQLIDALDSTDSPETYTDALQHSTLKSNPSGQTISSQKCLTILIHESPSPEQFIAKYDELKDRNADLLSPFVHLMAQVTEDKKLKRFLEKTTKKANVNKSAECNMKMIDVPSVVNKLKEAAKHSKEHEERKKKLGDDTNYLGHSLKLSWPISKPDMSLDFCCDTTSLAFNSGPIPHCSQENFVVEDLLCVLEGVEGEYIIPQPVTEKFAMRTFSISPEVDPTFKEYIKRMLPMAANYSMVVRFVEEHRNFEHGQVNHALSAAMMSLLKDYRVFVAQLESQREKNSFNLPKMLFYCQPMMHDMDILAKIASSIGKSGARGGKVLSLLHEQIVFYMGNPKSQELCLFLTQMASVPYLQILEKWLYKGTIYDPYHEFLVEDNEVFQFSDTPKSYSADYWEKRYTISRERIPIFLERMADMILRTGKYLNVIRQCGKNVKPPKAETLVYSITERQHVEAIESAYSFASKTLLQLIMEENDLMGRLRSVKHYFLLDQGDFIVQFMDSCESELCKNIDDLVPTRLETLLELALRTSVASQDPYKEEIGMELLPYDLIFQMCKILKINTFDSESFQNLQCDKKYLTGLMAFSFNYEVKWPVSLIINYNAIACYQMIFRHLFYCKHVERLLCRVWLKNKFAKSFSLRSSQMYVAAFALRQRMLNCVQNLEYYTMVEVIEPNWVMFLNKMSKVTNIDEVLLCHSDFLDSCLKDSMLTNPDLLQNVYYLLDICIEFYEFLQQMGQYFIDAELTSMIGSGYDSSDSCGEEHPGPGQSETSPGRSYIRNRIVSESDSFEQAIAKLDKNFTESVVLLMEQIMTFESDNNSDKLLNLLYRLNINNFYDTGAKETGSRTGGETSG